MEVIKPLALSITLATLITRPHVILTLAIWLWQRPGKIRWLIHRLRNDWYVLTLVDELRRNEVKLEEAACELGRLHRQLESEAAYFRFVEPSLAYLPTDRRKIIGRLSGTTQTIKAYEIYLDYLIGDD